MVVLDEAYADFAEVFAAERGVEYSRGVEYVREGRNVIVCELFRKRRDSRDYVWDTASRIRNLCST